MAHEIRIAIGTSQLEVPILGRQPRLEHLRDVDTTVANDQRTRRLLAAVASVALDVDDVVPLLMHPITTLLSGGSIA
jgi:hypothetical protein